MKKLNPFFTTGTIGMVVISVLHIALTLVFSIPVHPAFFVLYPAFAVFMAAGYVQVSKNRKKLIPIKVKK